MSSANIDGLRKQRPRRRVYSRDFKLHVVRRVTQGLSSAELVRDFGVSPTMVARWLREWQRDPAHAFRGYGQRKPVQDRVERMRRKIKRLMAERDLLKKASARYAMKLTSPMDSLQNIGRAGQ